VALGSRYPPQSRGLIMAAPSHVFTISRVAEILGENEDWLYELVPEMEPEDGSLTILDTNDQSTIAFTLDGRAHLRQLVIEHKK
jgi:hypothetical protein